MPASAAVSSGNGQSASIIAPGREGSQSARLPGYGRKVKPRSAPARAVSGQGRLGVRPPCRPAKFGKGAPRRVRSQAIALTHQGPHGVHVPRALALLPHRVLSSQRQQLPVMTLKTSIIAPGREASQSGGVGACAIMQDPDERGRHESVKHRCRTYPGPRAARECVGGGLSSWRGSRINQIGQRRGFWGRLKKNVSE